MDQFTRALTPEQIARVEARPVADAVPVAARVLPTFAGGKERTITVPLDYPMEFEGREINEVVIRRPSMREWRAYVRVCQDEVAKNGSGADDAVDQPWVSIPAIVLEELDFVDATRVEAAQEGFFARPGSQPETDEAGTSNNTSSTGEA